MKPILRRSLGGVALVGALASVVAGRERPTLDVSPAEPQVRSSASLVSSRGLDLDKLALRAEHGEEKKGVDPFAPKIISQASSTPNVEPSPSPSPAAPVASFTVSCPGNRPNCTVDASRSTSGSPITKWSWSFGNGTTSSVGPKASVQYRATGTYTIMLTITDGLGRTASAQQSVTIRRL